MKILFAFGWMLALLALTITLIFGRHSRVSQASADDFGNTDKSQGQILNSSKNHPEHIPEKMNISKLNLELEVEPAVVEGNKWTIHDNAASWLESSGGLISGNMVIYAHNQRRVFGGIKNLKVGDEIEVESQNTRAVYKIYQHFEGKAEDIKYINEVENRLTLYTCSGPLDVNRYFVMAKIVSVENI